MYYYVNREKDLSNGKDRGESVVEFKSLVLNVKSELLDMLTGDKAIESYEEWSHAIFQLFDNYFEVKEIEFFILHEDKSFRIRNEENCTNIVTKLPFNSSILSKETDKLLLFRQEQYSYANTHFLLNDYRTGRLGFLVFKSTPVWKKFYKSSYGRLLIELIEQTLLSVGKIVYLNNREESSKRLFDMTRLFNSTMDSKIILDGLVKTVADAFPQVSVDLLLSHEQKNLSHSFKLLDYMNERSLTMDAFVSGELTSEQLPDKSVQFLNAPIKGKQAIYGVVQLTAPIQHIFSTSKKEFLEIVSSTVGSALENARLYDQSHHLIKELKLVNETSRRLNDNLDPEQMIIFLKQQLTKAFKPDEISFVFYDREKKHKVSPASTSFFRTLLSTYYVEYASNYFVKEKVALFDANFGDTLKEPVPYESYIAVPITNQDKVIGFVAMLHASNYYFSFDSFKLMQALISHSSLAFSNSLLRDQLQELVDKDHLTRLFTRNYLDRMIEKSLVTDDRGVFLLMDVDNFKNVNDTYGHATGDLVLKSISDCIQMEVGSKGVAARWGGEEIAIYLPFASEAEGITCSKLLLEKIPTVTEPSVTISIGMKNWNSEDVLTFEELFHYADAALYSAKNNGKNQLNIYAASFSHE